MATEVGSCRKKALPAGMAEPPVEQESFISTPQTSARAPRLRRRSGRSCGQRSDGGGHRRGKRCIWSSAACPECRTARPQLENPPTSGQILL
jgi:hypothetical protein